jgi:integrase
MPRLKLTSAAIEKLKTSNGRRQEFFDSLLPGLALRVTKRGVKSWVLFYRPDRKLVRVTLGRYPILSLADARTQARSLLQGVTYRQIAPTPPDTVPTTPKRLFKDAHAEFIERYAKPNTRSWQETEHLGQRKLFPVFGDKDIGDVKKSEVIALMDNIIDGGAPVLANLTFSHLRKFYNWCKDRGYIEKSPCEGLSLPTKVTSRERVLTDDEIKKIWHACDKIWPPFADVLKVLLLTGQRKSEVAGMRWTEIQDDIWILPGARTKNKSSHAVPLTSFVKQIIERQQKGFDLVFTSTGETPISGFGSAKEDIDAASGVTGWRIHDLRRTCATGMARLKVPPHVVEKVLNHKSGAIRGVAAVYNRHGYTEETQEALEKWAEWIHALVRQ